MAKKTTPDGESPFAVSKKRGPSVSLTILPIKAYRLSRRVSNGKSLSWTIQPQLSELCISSGGCPVKSLEVPHRFIDRHSGRLLAGIQRATPPAAEVYQKVTCTNHIVP
ncbi:MAG: hypothetical protein RQ753_05250, partial [Desulfurivibrionaceae bacterium]|nr:hypothetical protein [Desulfurivibrionaceae bacterium]